ncbi:DUF5642 family protein [Mycobacterium montefiorense]|uniref:DUF5642 domain-containing protein n=1 Tax=Mycobacterium montefiorense TaxID=154654 RepID=A0AA37PKT1_9MYCO|nr:DUF5642 family protein [Mycobacterium montefiorense]GBG40053.1 hypothetical protein MmonteBS_44250 [Mycobacterium montefiorense]GKU33587.1 hypothetical protein NJB14191_09340 [Mycobacterium montefiorense]GKU39525.1 hypothetical protein NJB14192_15180 [Mycobacterium montefiorense]GKU43801.1 hypothetical protein NJB14194_04340 [Mycobacterium montefiorense]GKU52707.1 hypothetical protein NJB14195_39490 [Mycobacterium montefiorense]
MRPFWFGAVLTASVTACGAHSPAHRPSASPSPSAHGTVVNPANIKRVVRDLPPNYEVTSGIPSAASPRVIWGLDADATSKPAVCATLADPGKAPDRSAQGLSASGQGGIVNAVVVALPGPVDLDRNVADACGQFTMTDAHTTATVRLTDPHRIDGAETLGMVVDTKSAVEAGTEIDSRAYTFIAYLGGYYAFTTLTTDPGSALPALPPQFAADLLAKTVSTLRS